MVELPIPSLEPLCTACLDQVDLNYYRHHHAHAHNPGNPVVLQYQLLFSVMMKVKQLTLLQVILVISWLHRCILYPLTQILYQTL